MIKTKQKEMMINEKNYIVIINKKRIKNTYIRVNSEGQILVNTHHLASEKQIEDLILMHKDKIIRSIESKVNRNLPLEKMAYLGNVYDLEIIKSPKFMYQILENRIQLCITEEMNVPSSIEMFYKLEAQKIINHRVKNCFEHFKTFYSIPIPMVSLRKMKSRYGTCYYKKNKIILNYFLVKYEITSIDFVIYHELCHFIYPNHSKSFYKLLSTVYPEHTISKQLLNKF